MNDKPLLITTDNLCLTLPSSSGHVDILKNIMFELSVGERISIVGPSGSGKTSLLMLLAGLERPTSGHVFIDNQDITTFNEDQLAKFRCLNMGIVFQNFHLIPTMTAAENTSLPLDLLGQLDPKRFNHDQYHQRDYVHDVLSQVGLSHRLHHYPSQLSGGEQQRVSLARAFITKPRMIFADEPTGNLDQETGARVVEVLFDLCKIHHCALVLITHDPVLAAKTDRVIVMKNGFIDPVVKR